MRGGVFIATPTNLGGLALYNNSQGAELLVVWFWSLSPDGANLGGIGVFKGKPPGSAVTPSPLVTDEAIYAGQLVQLDTTTVYARDFVTGFTAVPQGDLSPMLPWAVLQPGWSLVLQDQTTADPCAANIIWQVAHPQDLYGKDCQICDAIA